MYSNHTKWGIGYKAGATRNIRTNNDVQSTIKELALLNTISPANGQKLILLYLAAFTAAELIISYLSPIGGTVLYSILLFVLLIHTVLVWDKDHHELLLCLIFAPLIRILSLSLPLMTIPQEYWYLITSIPLFVAAFIAARLLDYSPKQLGLQAKRLISQLAYGIFGLILGLVEYLILRPEPIVRQFDPVRIAVVSLILLLSTGFLEELIFRGLLQKAAIDAIGRNGILVVAGTFAILHLGYKSLANFVFVFVVALIFSWKVQKTGSIIGVSLAHGVINITSFLIAPFIVPMVTVW